MTIADLISFECRIAELWEAGELPYLLHLSGGNERELLSIFENIHEGDWVFSSHRNHYHALLSGISPQQLEDTIRRGDSMFVFSRERRFFTSAILAGTAGIAAGVALGLKLKGSDARVWCFLGDGAEEEGHFYEAVMFTEGQRLPLTFVIEDNDRAGVASVSERTSGWRMEWPSCVRRYRYQATFPHAGNGTTKKIEFRS